MVEKKEGQILRSENLIILLMSITVVLVTMNTAMFNLALVALSHDFNLSPSTVSLTVTCYSIIFAISSITYSRLSDFVPLNRLFTISLLLTGGASVTAMFSSHFWLLLTARVVQAAGAGGALALSILFLSRYIPLARRGRSMTFIMSSVSLGFGLGPVLGGLVVQYLGWKYLFAIPSLLLFIVPLLVRYMPKETLSRRAFDLLGAVSLSVGTSGLLLFLTNYDSISLLIGIIGLLVFTLRIRRTEHPFLPASLLANKTYMMLAMIGVLSYLCNFATLFLLPQMLLRHFGLSTSQAGFVIFPGAASSMLLSRRVGAMIDKRGNNSMLLVAPVLILAAAIWFAGVGTRFWVADIFGYMIMNLGFTVANSSVYNEISHLLPSSQIGAGTGLFQLMQFLSGAFSIAVLSRGLEWQRTLSLDHVYGNLFWGLAWAAVLAGLCASLYIGLLSKRYIKNSRHSL